MIFRLSSVCKSTTIKQRIYVLFGVAKKIWGKISLMNRGNYLCSAKNFRDSSTSGTDFPTLGIELTQTASNFNINHLTDNQDNSTDTGYLMLAPSPKITSRQTIRNANYTVDGKEILVGLAGSVDKANSSPASVSCMEVAPGSATLGYSSVTGSNRYNCSTLIELPSPRGGSQRDPNYSFIRLSMPYVEPTNGIRFEVSFYQNEGDAADPKKAIAMNETQYIVSVQGQTGDRVRRVSAYLGGMNNDAIVPMWSASIGGGNGVSKCSNGPCDTSNGETDKRMQYTTTHTQGNTTYNCTFSYATRDIFNQPIAYPSVAEMNAACRN